MVSISAKVDLGIFASIPYSNLGLKKMPLIIFIQGMEMLGSIQPLAVSERLALTYNPLASMEDLGLVRLTC